MESSQATSVTSATRKMVNLTDMTAYGPLFPNDEELRAVVNSIYGPGALGGWLLSCVSLLISLASPEDRDAINNDFIVAVIYPVVAASDLVVHMIRFAKRWRIYKDWLGLRLSIQNLQQGSLEVWQEWLWVGFGPAATAQYGDGIHTNSVPNSVAAFPYLGYACFQVITLSLVFFGIFLILDLHFSSSHQTRAAMILVIAYIISIVSWLHLSLVGRDYDTAADFTCLLPHRRYGRCNSRIYNVEDWQLNKTYIWRLLEIKIRGLDIAVIMLLLVSYLAYWPFAVWTEKYLPFAARARTSFAARVRIFFKKLASTTKHNAILIIPTLLLAFAHLVILLLIRAATVPMAVSVEKQPMARMFPFGVRPLGGGRSASLKYVEGLSNGVLPVTSFKLTDLDQMLALIAGALAAALSLKEVLEKRGIMNQFREWIKKPRNASARPPDRDQYALELRRLTPAKLKKPRSLNVAQNF